jgi:hypothetical protein
VKCFEKEKIEKTATRRKKGYLEEAQKRNSSKNPALFCFDPEDIEFLKTFREGLPKESSLPSFSQMAKNVAQAAKDEIKARINKEPPVSQEEVERRLEICRGCEFFSPNVKALTEAEQKQERCIKCGCFMSFKARLRSQHCPIGKW